MAYESVLPTLLKMMSFPFFPTFLFRALFIQHKKKREAMLLPAQKVIAVSVRRMPETNT